MLAENRISDTVNWKSDTSEGIGERQVRATRRKCKNLRQESIATNRKAFRNAPRGLDSPDVTPCPDKDLRNPTQLGAAKSGAVVLGWDPREDDLGLARLIHAWPQLPGHTKAAILALVEAAYPDARKSQLLQ
jgi:hypothetical protein